MGFLYSFFYRGLYVLAAGSLLLLIWNAFANGVEVWEWYGRIYMTLLLGYTWGLFIVLFLGDLRPNKFPTYNGQSITVVMPCYNEDPALLTRAVASIMAAKGNKNLVIVDDGSTNGIRPLLESFEKIPGITVHFLPENVGKREALYQFTKQFAHGEFVVTVDSDTVLDRDALVRIVEPLLDEKVGAATGDVRLLNEDQNTLTRMIATYYWTGLHIYKKAQSVFGNVVCCSGCLSAYRTSLLKQVIDKFVQQEFYGEKCTHSEDRHLTNLVLERGYKVHFVPEAISYTETPATVMGFLRQQQRWKRGYIRESVYTLTYAWKDRPGLFLQLLLWDLTAPFFSLGMRIAALSILFLNPPFFLLYILPSWILFMVTQSIFLVIYAPKKIPGLFTFALFHQIFLYWMNLYALVTVKNKGWITR